MKRYPTSVKDDVRILLAGASQGVGMYGVGWRLHRVRIWGGVGLHRVRVWGEVGLHRVRVQGGVGLHRVRVWHGGFTG